jgi:Tfp pilus assembly protein PilO
MSAAGGQTLLRRIAAEHRRALIIIGVLLVANVLAFAGYVYPLGQRVANIEQRDRTAEQALRAAQAEHAQAAGTLTGKDRASAELATFYEDVLPADLTGARRLTHLRLPQLARQSGLRYVRSQYEAVEARGSTLNALRISMILSGSYADVRTFIHALETSPEFVVIDNVALAEDDPDVGSLVVTLQLSTYYRGIAR